MHPGWAACYDTEAWRAQHGLRATQQVDAWYRLMETYRKEGHCWLTRAEVSYEVVPSDVEGTVRIRAIEKEPGQWAYISREALGG